MESNPVQLSPCKYCKMLIHPNSGKCPACGGNQPIFWTPDSRPSPRIPLWGVLLGVAGLITLVLMARACI